MCGRASSLRATFFFPVWFGSMFTACVFGMLMVGGVWGGKIRFKDLVCLGVKISQRFGNRKVFVNL